MQKKYTNQLIKESSPYLLQHAHNPVDWHAWSEEAFAKAKAENKPVLVSIGYSTCHWCHVMERESFEDEQVAAFMNKYFINIKVDREERPDVDQIYMEVCQVINGSGGWPLNCFLLPDGRAFYAGTYFPPVPAHQRPSWKQVLQRIAHSYEKDKTVLEEQATRLMEWMHKSEDNFLNAVAIPEGKKYFDKAFCNTAFEKMRESFDTRSGGFGGAPKFPGTMVLQYLLNYSFYSKNEAAKKHALFSLNKMIEGGIYDQLGGGFSRYATDNDWLIPHFEKMLYDNALLVVVLAEAYKWTKDIVYKNIIEETLSFIQREMTSDEGGFYAALDADSEGIEGKFYVWQKEEIDEILGAEAAVFNEYFGVSQAGNWENTNILNRQYTLAEFARLKDISVSILTTQLDRNKQQLLNVREQRIRPGLDDKIILSWNALQCSAYCSAYMAIGEEGYKDVALRNIEFLLERFAKKEQPIALHHTYKDGIAKYDAFLDDYAFLIAALLDVYELTYDTRWIAKSVDLIEYVLAQFWDTEKSLFFYTTASQKDIIIRKKELYDSALPSGNSTMANNLERLGIMTGNKRYREQSEIMLKIMHTHVLSYPTSFARWADVMLSKVYPYYEIAVTGKEAVEKANAINRFFIPNKLIMAATQVNSDYPLLVNKPQQPETLIYICSDYSCQSPVTTLEEFKAIIF